MLTTKSRNAIIKGILTRKSPVYVQYALSKLCNLNCRMCGVVEARKLEKELNLEQIRILAERLDKLKVGVLVLTGGEPFMRKDLSEIIHIFSEKGIDVRLQTNALLAKESDIVGLVDAGLKEVTISLDTLDSKKQDFICDKKGTWKEIIKAISLFSKYLPEKGGMPVINTVVSKLNIDDVVDVVKFTTKMGFYNSIIPIHLSDMSGFILRKKAEPFRFKESDFEGIDRVYSELIKMKKKGYYILNTYKFLKKCPDFLKYGKVYWKCDSPDLYFSISPNGYFLPCVDLKGDKLILDEDFIDVFNSKEFRSKIKEQVKNCTGCMYACYPEISYFCKNPFVLIERLKQAIKMSVTKRRAYTYEELLKIIDEIKNENIFSKTKV